MSEEQKRIKVLYVDDEPDFLALTKAFLERENADFSIDTATSAEEGLELLKGGKYGAVVSDYQMPVMDGLEFLKTLRASGNTIPFIVFTGKGREEVAIEALNRGANGYLQKGTDIASMFGTLAHVIKQEVETKRAGDELVELKKEQQIVLESVPAMIFHMDHDSNYIYTNRRFADTFGLKPADFKGKSTKALFPEEAEAYIKSDKEVVKSGVPKIRAINEIITPKGKRWLRTDKVPVKDAEGNVTGIIGFGLDITARKKAEDELRNANKQLRDTIEFLPDATFVIDLDKKVIAWNRAIEEMTGVRKDDIIGKGDYAYAVPFYGIKRPILIDLIFLRDKEIEARYDYVKREGNTLFAEVFISSMYGGKGAYLWGTATPLLDSEGNIVGAIESIRDITERKRAEEALRETRDYLEKLINYANAPIIVWDPESKISQFNHAFEHLTGYAASEVIGQKLSMLFPEASRDDSLSRIARALRGEYWESVEIPILRKDGEIRLALWNSANIYAKDGTTLLATIAQGTDITERKRAEEKIEHLNAVLRAIRRVNQLVVREKDREKLLQSTCDSLIATRGYHSAWIALIDKKGGFETTAQAGVDKGFSATIKELKSGELPSCVQKAVEQTGIVTITDPAVECSDCPLAGICADKARFTIRLEYGGRIYGFVNVAIPVEMAVDEDEQSLFCEMAGDVAFALHDMELEEERKQAEEELRIAKEEYCDLYERAPLGYHTVDSQGRITDMNKTELHWLGYTKEEVIGKKTIFDIQTQESANRGRKLLQRLVKEGGVLDIELEFVCKDGSVMPINLHASILRNSKGEFIRTRSIVIDLTERKETETKLAKIADSVDISAFAINKEHKITHWNTAVESLTGFKKEAAVGSDKQWIAFYAEKRPVMADLIVAEAPESEFEDWYGDKYKKSSLIEGAYEAVDFFPTLGEEGKWLLFTAAPLKDSEGTVIGAIETLQDITERKRAENALKESEEKYHNLVERANDGITIIQDNIVKYLNSRLAEMWGGTVEEVIGTPFTDYIPPDERRNVVDHYKRRMAGEDVTPIYETVLRRKDGSKIYAELNAGTITFQGTPADLVFIHDITERKVAEKAIRKSEQEYRSLVESTEDSVYLVDRDCKYLFVNEKHLSRIGMPKDRVIGKTYGELHSEDETAEFAEIVERIFKTGKSASQEHISHWGNRDVLRTLSPVKDSEGRTTAVTVVSKDITERKKTEEVLRESEEKYRELAELLPEVIFETDLEGNITYANKVAFDSFGYTQSDFDKGVNALQMLIPEDRDRGKENIQRVLNGGKIGSREYTAQRKDKTTFPVIINSNPIIHETKPVGLRGVITDITDRKKAEKERERLLKELEAKNTELGRFTYTVSHDLRSPLITIQGFTDMIQNDLAQNEVEKAKDNLKFIDKAATKMEKLLSDTLKLSRIGRMVNPPEDVPFGDIVKEALGQTAGEIKVKNIEVSVAKDFPAVHVDRMRIAEVLVNLIANSINYMAEQPQPKIEIGHRIDNGESVFFVQDNGIGIDPGQHEKVFDLFYRVDLGGKGTGAGLAIVKRIIEVHNGRIWIESEKGKGCTVCFTLPVQ